MATRVQISNATWLAAMQTETVRRALNDLAAEKRSLAEHIASSEGVDLEAEVVNGTRPKGRPFARVQSRNVAQEWGDSVVKRRRILGRTAES